MIDIKIAKTEEENHKIFKFRYDIYIKELNKEFLINSDQSKALTDDLDKEAYNLYSVVDEKIVGCMRCTLQNYDDRLSSKFGLKFISENIRYAQLDRFMLANNLRGTKMAVNYFTYIYRFGLMNNVQIALIEVEEKLMRLYKAIGFTPYREVDLQNNSKSKRIQMYFNLNNYLFLDQNNSLLKCEYLSHMEVIENSFNNTSMLITSSRKEIATNTEPALK